MVKSKALRRAFVSAVFGCGAVIALAGGSLGRDGTPAATAGGSERNAPAAQGAEAEPAALRRLAMKYIGLKDLTAARRAAAQKAYDAEKENFLKSYDPTYASDKVAYQAAAEEYEATRKAVWQSALDELKAEGYEFAGTRLEGEDLQYRKRPVEEDLAGPSTHTQAEPNEGFLAIVSKYVQSNADIQTLGARRLQAYKALAAHQDALIEKIDAEVPAALAAAAQQAPAKTAPLESPKPVAKEPGPPLAETPPKPAAEAPAKSAAMERTQPLVEPPAKPHDAAPPRPPAEETAKPQPRPPELRMSEEHAPPQQAAAAESSAPVAPPPPQAGTLPRAEAPREAIGKAASSREARTEAPAGGLPPLPTLPRLPDEPGAPALPEAPALPAEAGETAAVPATAVAPVFAAPSEFAQLRLGVFGNATWARPNLFWSGPWGVAVAPFASPRSLDQSFGGGGAQAAVRLRPFDAASGATALRGLVAGLALDAAWLGGGAHGGLAPFFSTSFTSRFQATQRIEVGVDVDLGGKTTITPIVTAGFSEAQFAMSSYGAALGTVVWGSASGFRLGATYGGGLELKVAGAPTLQILYLRHAYNPTTTPIWGGSFGGAFVGANKGLSENELRVGLVIPVPQPW